MSDRFENFSWRRTNVPPAGRTEDIFFLDENLGWAVNNAGKVIKTTDGFNTFRIQQTIPSYLRCCGFASERLGWIGTFDPNARLYRMTDGSTWEPDPNVPPGAPVKICGICVVDEQTVYAAGTNRPWEDAAILKTTNGGAKWERIDMGRHAASLIDIYFENSQEGWVVGGVDVVNHPGRPTRRSDVIPTVLRTTDGGATWTNVLRKLTQRAFPTGEWGWKIQKLNDKTMFVSLENFHDGAILRSDDGGRKWERLRINDRQRNSNLEGIGFLDENRGWVGGWGNLSQIGGYSSKTEDGGQNWDNANEIGFGLNRFRFIGNPVNVAFASGDTVYKFTDEPVADAELVALAPPTEQQIVSSEKSVQFSASVEQGAKYFNVVIWDRFGGELRTLALEENPAPGERAIEWDFRDDDGALLPAGPYFLRISTDRDTVSRLIFRTKP